MSLKLFAWGEKSGEHPTPHAGLGERGGVRRRRVQGVERKVGRRGGGEGRRRKREANGERKGKRGNQNVIPATYTRCQ